LLHAPDSERQPLVWAEPLEFEPAGASVSMWDALGRWWAIAVVLVLIAYALPLMDIFRLTRYGSPGIKPF
jgi:hypothetical protein